MDNRVYSSGLKFVVDCNVHIHTYRIVSEAVLWDDARIRCEFHHVYLIRVVVFVDANTPNDRECMRMSKAKTRHIC